MRQDHQPEHNTRFFSRTLYEELLPTQLKHLSKAFGDALANALKDARLITEPL